MNHPGRAAPCRTAKEPRLCREILVVALRQLLPKQSVVLIDNQSAAASLKVKEQAGKVGELDQSADAQDILSIRLITLSGSASVRTILLDALAAVK